FGGFARVKPAHLVYCQPLRSGFGGEVRHRGACVIKRVPIWIAVASEGKPGNCDSEYGRILGPNLIGLGERTQNLFKCGRIVFGSHEKGPGLLVGARGRPPCRFEQATELVVREWLICESARAPTLPNQIVNRMVRSCRLMHDFLPDD